MVLGFAEIRYFWVGWGMMRLLAVDCVSIQGGPKMVPNFLGHPVWFLGLPRTNLGYASVQ